MTSVITETPDATAVATESAARLSSLRRGDAGRVVGVDAALPAAVSRRLADLGFVADAPVICLRRAPLGSPVVYCIGESEVCLRGDLAGCVLVSRSA